MTAQSARAPGPRSLLGRAWSSSRPLAFVGVTMLLVLAVSLAGLLLDPRVITGAPAWLKPMKFAISSQPVISPDALTLGALFALLVTAGTAASAVVLIARRGRQV